MSGLNKGPETTRWTDFRSELKLLASMALAWALVWNPNTTQAQTPPQNLYPKQKVEQKAPQQSKETDKTPVKSLTPKDFQKSDWGKKEAVKTIEMQKKSDYINEAENLMIKYYRNYQKHFEPIFRDIRKLNTHELTQDDMNQILTIAQGRINDCKAIKLIEKEEEEASLLLWMLEHLMWSKKFINEQALNEDLHDIILDFMEDIRPVAKSMNEKVEAAQKQQEKELAESNQRLAESKQRLAESKQRLAESKQRLEAITETVEKNFQSIENRIRNFKLSTFLTNKIEQNALRTYFKICKKDGRTPIPEAINFAKELEKRGKNK